MLLTLAALAADPPATGTLLAAFVADEEALSIGTEHLVKRPGIDAAIVIEPHGLHEVVVAHQGFGWIDITTHGVAAHGSAPERGVDSIGHMAEVIAGLQVLDRDVFEPTSGLPCGKTVYHASTIGGGTDYATYPSRTTLGIEIGTQPGERLANRVADIEAIFADVAARRPAFSGEIEVKLERDPFTSSGHERLMKVMNAAFEAVRGTEPGRGGAERVDRRRPAPVGRHPHGPDRARRRQPARTRRMGIYHRTHAVVQHPGNYRQNVPGMSTDATAAATSQRSYEDCGRASMADSANPAGPSPAEPMAEHAAELHGTLREHGISAKLIGGLAIALRCPGMSEHGLSRDYHDIDVCSRSREAKKMDAAMGALGLEPHKHFNAMNYGRQMMYSDPVTGLHVDVFLDVLRMCQELALTDRLGRRRPSVASGR